MNVLELLKWQWSGYAQYHGSRANLLLHIAVVPVFLAGNVGLLIALTAHSVPWGLLSLLAMVVSVALQGRGHKQETNPPAPFTGAGNALARIFLEQWITFPRFVLSGGWLHAFRQHRAS
ncbi:Mpo1-like protein [Rhodoferax ferrireducens]|uniref:Mpo1-like protein n=1 Tax=Rhodoferax ferrireducens TaxID=192843 RepID=UPI000E0D117B|nr:Mpo1-like protein [Rhodoferax ferrireducens]